MTRTTTAQGYEEVAGLLAELVHDVGKYVSRISRNLPPDDLPAGLLELLAADFYNNRHGSTTRAVFESLVRPLRRVLQDRRLDAVEESLVWIDDHRNLVEQGSVPVIREAARRALRIDALLRELKREWGETYEAK